MAERYVKRYSLPERQYIAGAPVVLSKGALLEDKEENRLVAQLKFTNIDSKPVSRVKVTVGAFLENGNKASEVTYIYNIGKASRGQSFGHYLAIPLPLSDANKIEVELKAVAYTDGSVWRNSDKTWITLPAFTKLSLEGELLDFSRRHISDGRYEYEQAADIWYCTCGAVNKAGEHRCHKCRLLHEQVAKYAEPVTLATLLQAKKDAEQKRQEDIEKLKAEAGAKLTAFKDAAVKKASEAADSIERAREEKAREKAEKGALAAATAATAMAEANLAEESIAEVPAKKGGKGKFIAIAVIAILLIVVIAFTLPKLMGGGNRPSGGRVNVNVTSEYDIEDVEVIFTENQFGEVFVNMDTLNEYFPEGETFVMEGTPYLGDELDSYIRTSYAMAELVGSEGEWHYGYGSFNLNPSWENGIMSLLVFEDDTEICAYGVGYFENLGNGEWAFDMKSCNYDIGSLLREETRAFRSDQIPEVGPETIFSDDVKYFIRGFNYSTNSEEYNNMQKYSLWSKFTSGNGDYFISAEYLENYLPEKMDDNPVWTYFLLLNEDYSLIGYSCYTTYDSSSVGTYTIETPYDKEMIEYRVPIVNDAMKFELELLKEIMPQADIFTMNLINIPPVKTDIEEYIKISSYMSNYVLSEGHLANSWQGSASMHINSTGYALLLFSEDGRLVGYSVGVPDRNQSSEMPIHITLCDYDINGLLTETYAQFENEGFYEEIEYIPLEIAKETGEAEYVLAGINSGSSDYEWVKTMNEFHFWSLSGFPEYLDHIKNGIDTIDYYNVGEGELHFLLLDGNHDIIGYTIKNPH